MSLHYTSHPNWEWVIRAALLEYYGACSVGYESKNINRNEETCIFKLIREKCMKDLPSQLRVCPGKKRKSTYSLFRIELSQNNAQKNVISHCCWMSGQMFGYLDAKDALYKHLKVQEDVILCSIGKEHVNEKSKPTNAMPATVLLPWDYEPDPHINSDSSSVVEYGFDLPSTPTCLLKAALGSGGFGIYFIHNKEQVLDILRRDAKAARASDYFIPSLMKDHGGIVPQWSLQQYIESVRVFPDRARCQFRVYAISVYNLDTNTCRMYIYDTVEVRVPRWDIELDDIVCRVDEKNDTNSALSCSKDVDLLGSGDLMAETSKNSPMEYNEHRNKAKTYRYVLEEMPPIEPAAFDASRGGGNSKSNQPPLFMKKDVFHQRVKQTLLDLKPSFEENLEQNLKKKLLDYCEPFPVDEVESECTCDPDPLARQNTSNKSNPILLSITGIDLMLTQASPSELRPYVIEFNNNPAIPPANKLMTEAYRTHLVELVGSLLHLGGLHDAAVGFGPGEVLKSDLRSNASSEPARCIKVW